MNKSGLEQRMDARVLFVDMNSFFASCEQQVNFYLRGRPVAVCVYPGKFGAVIAPSIEAKRKGVKTGMRLNEAMALCPDLVPLETHPQRYREYHVKIIDVLRKYSQDVIPKSIDEAVVDLTGYELLHPDPIKVAKQIKEDIKNEVGDWLKCSIGIAPNSFLAKLGSDIKKPDGITVITHQNIDVVLSRLKLTDLPGIAKGMSERLQRGGINTPVELRHARPDRLKNVCKSIVGFHWHQRLNFMEVEISNSDYKSMSAMRHLSSEQRRNLDTLHEILLSLCLTLEKRMVHHNVYCKSIHFSIGYDGGQGWDDNLNPASPVQDGIEILNMIKARMAKYESATGSGALINGKAVRMGVVVSGFINEELIQYSLFENNVEKDILRKAVYKLKDRFGANKVMKAAQLSDVPVLPDVIGFGNVKDLHYEKEEYL